MVTLIRPHTAASSPVRPTSSYSVSTIRRVTPSPNSLTEALHSNFVPHSTPRRRPHSSAELPRPWPPTPGAGIQEDKTENITGTPTPALRRRGRASPLKRPFSLPPTTMEIPPPSRPETPSPMSAEQRRSQYMPMGDQNSQDGDTIDMVRTLNPNWFEPASPLPVQQRQVLGESSGRQTNASGTNKSAVRRALFSTPGRDELEAKKPEWEREGPFLNVTSAEQLAEERRRLSVGKKERAEGSCGCGCVVM